MEDQEFEKWVTTQRKIVESYLQKEGISNPNVGPWPAFEVYPYFAIWAVESKKVQGKIGWWAFSGDCPTDYVKEDGTCHPRNALKSLLDIWRSYIPHMKNGTQPPNVKFGDGSNIIEFGQLLEDRVKILEDWALDDDLWEDR